MKIAETAGDFADGPVAAGNEHGPNRSVEARGNFGRVPRARGRDDFEFGAAAVQGSLDAEDARQSASAAGGGIDDRDEARSVGGAHARPLDLEGSRPSERTNRPIIVVQA